MPSIEDDFLAALDRLRKGKPQNKDLAAKAKAGKLKVNAKTVAMESGHSRTSLYKFDDIVARITAAGESAPDKPTSTSKSVIDGLRVANAQLKQEKQAALDAVAAILLRMKDLEENTETAISMAVRVAKRSDQNMLVGEKFAVIDGGKDGR